MYIFISILIVIVAVFLTLIVIIQNSKGGGLASTFASSNQVMGVRKTTDFLEKATWWLAGSMVGLAIIATLFLPRSTSSSDSIIKDDIIETTTTQDPNKATPFGDPILDDNNKTLDPATQQK